MIKKENKYRYFIFYTIPILFICGFLFFNIANAGMTIGKPSNFLTLNTGLVGWWTFDGKDVTDKVYDRSCGLTCTTGNNGYFTGGATSSAKVIGKIGQGLKFDGVDDYVNIGNTDRLLSLNSLSVSVWIKILDQACLAGNCPVLTFLDQEGGGAQDGIFQFNVSSGEDIRFTAWNDSGASATANSNSSIMSIGGGWHHLVGIYNGSNVLLYIDGALQTDQPVLTGTTESATNESLQIGSIFNGLIDDARIYNRALSANEIKQLYAIGTPKINTSQTVTSTSSCTTGLSCGLVGYWTFDGKDVTDKVYDKSGGGNHGGFYHGATSSAKVIGKIGQGLNFNGTNSMVKIPDFDLADNTNTISVGAWVKYRVSSSTVAYSIISKTRALSSFSGWVLYRGSDEKYTFYVSSGVGSGITVSNNVYADTNWHYIVGVYNGSNVQVYVDGVASDSTPGSYSNTLANNTRSVCIGVTVGNDNLCGAATSFTPGTIDDVRIYSRALSADEIKQLYNMGK